MVGRPVPEGVITIKRIVTNIAAENIADAQSFYGDLLGLDVLMDLGWVVTFGSDASSKTQISVAREGGSGADVPDISIEVDNIEEIYGQAKTAGIDIVYELTDEPWGVRRFFLRDPFGKLVNILSHHNDPGKT